MKLKVIILVVLLSSNLAYAGSFTDNIKDTLRPYAIKFLGEQTAYSLLGEGSGIELPKIPKVKADARTVVQACEETKNQTKEMDKKLKQGNDYLYIKEVFRSTRNTEPNDNDIAKWMNVLNQGGAREAVYRAVVFDQTYRGMENYEHPVNKGVVKFSQYYLQKFVGSGIKKEALEKTNFFTLKRVVTDKTLDVLDKICVGNQVDFVKWYAVFSSELASDYPNVWSSTMRKTVSKKAHKRWADSVPHQYLKSEVIIKINMVYNYLIKGR